MSSEAGRAAGHVAWDIHLDAASHVAFADVPLWPLLEPGGAAAAALPGVAGSHEQWRADAARIARDPLDLATHARRVLLQCQGAAPGAGAAESAVRAQRLFAALVDLFLALGPHGPELRASLLTRARPWLPAAQHAFLAQHLAGGLGRHAALPPDAPAAPGAGVSGAHAVLAAGVHGAHAVLAAGVVGRCDLVLRHHEAPQPKPALERAIDLVDRGDAVAAQALLEQALLDDPTDDEVAEELGQLYRLNGAEAAAAVMAQRLRERGHAVPVTWPLG